MTKTSSKEEFGMFQTISPQPTQSNTKTPPRSTRTPNIIARRKQNNKLFQFKHNPVPQTPSMSCPIHPIAASMQSNQRYNVGWTTHRHIARQRRNTKGKGEEKGRKRGWKKKDKKRRLWKKSQLKMEFKLGPKWGGTWCKWNNDWIGSIEQCRGRCGSDNVLRKGEVGKSYSN